MFGLPEKTEFDKKIPKKKFYENLTMKPELKRAFVEHIKVIYWKNKISVDTVNIASGNEVIEIEVFEVRLNTPDLDENVLRQIDKEIPYHILFILEYEEKYQVRIGYKEAALGGINVFKVNGYYHTEWMDKDELKLKIEGLNMDSVYENFVRQIAGERLKKADSHESLKASVERDNRKQELGKKIAELQAKIRKEKQLNRQMEMRGEIKKMRKELEEMGNE